METIYSFCSTIGDYAQRESRGFSTWKGPAVVPSFNRSRPQRKGSTSIARKVAKPTAPPVPKVEAASKERMAFPLPDKPSIAVLPFVNLTGDPQQEFFSDGLTEDLITAFSKVGNLFVIARNSTFTYKGKPVKVQKVAEDLGVRYVLEGSIQKGGRQGEDHGATHRCAEGAPHLVRAL